MLFITMLKKKLLFNLRNTFLVLGSKGSELVSEMSYYKEFFFLIKVLKIKVKCFCYGFNYYCSALLESCSHFCLLPSLSLVSMSFLDCL